MSLIFSIIYWTDNIPTAGQRLLSPGQLCLHWDFPETNIRIFISTLSLKYKYIIYCMQQQMGEHKDVSELRSHLNGNNCSFNGGIHQKLKQDRNKATWDYQADVQSDINRTEFSKWVVLLCVGDKPQPEEARIRRVLDIKIKSSNL